MPTFRPIDGITA